MTTRSYDLLYQVSERVEPGAEVPSPYTERLEISLFSLVPAETGTPAHVHPMVLAMISRTLPLVSKSSAHELTLAQ